MGKRIDTPATNQNKELTDADVVSGGPLDPNSKESKANQDHASGNTQEPDEQPPQQTAQNTQVQTPIIVNGKSFKNSEDLAAYTAHIEQLNIAAAAAPSNQQQNQAPPELIDGRPISEVMFDDPARYNKYVIEKATENALGKMHEVNNQKTKETAFWEDFYTKNPDLKDMDKVVMREFKENFNELAKLPVEQAQVRLAKDSRAFVETILQKKGVRTTELPEGGASTLGTSGAGVSRVNKPEPKRSFVDQVKAARRRA